MNFAVNNYYDQDLLVIHLLSSLTLPILHAGDPRPSDDQLFEYFWNHNKLFQTVTAPGSTWPCVTLCQCG